MLSTTLVEYNNAPRDINKTGKPLRLKTGITLGFMFIWLFLVIFAFIAASDPAWLRNLSQFGRSDESAAMKGYGDNCLRQNNYKMAVANYQKALQIRPDYSEAKMSLAIAYSRLGNDDKGLDILWEELHKGTNQKEMTYFNIGDILARQGKKPEAIECYLKALNGEVDEDWVYYKLGVLYFDTKQYENSRIAFENSVRIRTNPVTPFKKMINASLIEFDSDKEILPNVERLSKIDITPADLKKYDMVTIENLNKVSPEIAKIDNYLGVIYSIEGDTAKARERFELSLQIWPDNADARKNLQILRQQQ